MLVVSKEVHSLLDFDCILDLHGTIGSGILKKGFNFILSNSYLAGHMAVGFDTVVGVHFALGQIHTDFGHCK